MISKKIGLPNTTKQLHVFCDASGKTYSTAAYLRFNNYTTIKVTLIFSKTQIDSIKNLTIPKMELMAVLLGTRIIKYLTE